MTVYIVDIRDVKTREELHSKIASVLPLPDYYGRNLDALFDVLTESAEERKIKFIMGKPVEDALDKYYSALCAMCGAAEEENPALTVEFCEEA